MLRFDEEKEGPIKEEELVGSSDSEEDDEDEKKGKEDNKEEWEEGGGGRSWRRGDEGADKNLVGTRSIAVWRLSSHFSL